MNFKTIMIAGASTLALIFIGCKSMQGYSAEEIGLRKTTLFSEEAQIQAYDYSGKAAGESELIERAFENAPPMIPHNLDGMLPITRDNNSCTGCHLPGIAEAVGATAMPKSHFYDLRNNKDLHEEMDENRFNCVICHTTQVNAAPLVENNFKADFRQDDGNTRSNLLDILNEGVK
ncbi:nitrate reductase cytochrome c-type subunit [Helicobacter canadensis]|uniref:Periplasmic nitrate reductase, electron transfer subunit n=1 Tax=Helicobacter canadensis MIT 98-5491 TaxID=537970 RepID=C5ZXD7_9HELI|nr:nitrate reductase cytochrome c-type subunit [Helicobacter canadensis]EES89805.1 NapB periplasmic nitrate reductase [Helicobacter canadensis MIT 98-5491]EFR48602.1 periplasmic nitrate reductase, diheme cytochrome c subunit [Helicobacter canadensis MIT 98-5491]STO99844.1 periplasmic nitrate reductase [Helicobacter canadensis]